MWRRTLGYLLDPSIPKPVENARIADLCCGTGIWLLDMARELPHAQLEGFDISTSQFPPREWLPSNMRLSKLDVLQPVPDDLVGCFDVIHIGLVVAVVKNDDPQPLLANILRMLKPGGYLQWDEADLGGLYRQPANAGVPREDVDALYGKINETFTPPHITYEWVRHMTNVLSEGGMDVLADHLVIIPDEIAYSWSHQQLMTLEELIRHVDKPPGKFKEWWDLYYRAREAVLQGISVRMNMVVAVGRKP